MFLRDFARQNQPQVLNRRYGQGLVVRDDAALTPRGDNSSGDFRTHNQRSGSTRKLARVCYVWSGVGATDRIFVWSISQLHP